VKVKREKKEKETIKKETRESVEEELSCVAESNHSTLMERNWNNNNCFESGETQFCLNQWEWNTRRQSNASAATSDADSERNRLSESEGSRSNSMSEVHPINRPIIQDAAGHVTGSTLRARVPVQTTGFEVNQGRSASSSSSSSSSHGDEGNKNRQNQKREKSQRKNDDKIIMYIFHLIPACDVPDLARLYQWWSEFKNAIDVQAVVEALQQSLTEQQYHLTQLMFRAIQYWDDLQEQNGAIGIEPELHSRAKTHYQMYQDVKFLSSHLLAEILSYSDNHK